MQGYHNNKKKRQNEESNEREKQTVTASNDCLLLSLAITHIGGLDMIKIRDGQTTESNRNKLLLFGTIVGHGQHISKPER